MGKNSFLDGATGETADQRKAQTTLAIMIVAGIVLALMSLGFLFGGDIMTVIMPEAGAVSKAAQAVKSE